MSDLKEKRQKARDLKSSNPTDAGCEPKSDSELHSDYLTIVENQRRAENEVRAVHNFFPMLNRTTQVYNLLVERLTLVLRADLADRPEKRGDHFPHPTMEDAAKVHSDPLL